MILAAAAELFARKGYPQVAMAEIAEAVGVQPSALYRHFSNKEDILQEAILALDVPEVSEESFEEILERLSVVTRDNPWAGVLWQRESRNLPLPVRADVTVRGQLIAADLGTALRAARPELSDLQAEMLAWSTMAIALGTFDPQQGDPARDEHLVQEMLRTAAEADIPAIGASTPLETSRVAGFQSRREALLAAAIPLFAERGYAAVSLDDVGAAVGIAGPSIYTHFPRKSDLLSTALHRANEVLWMDMSRVMALAEDERDALSRLLQCYITFSLNSVDFIQLLRAEVPQLPDAERATYLQHQNQYINEWVHLLRRVHPEATMAACETRVRTTLHVIHAVARRPHLGCCAGVDESLEVLGCALIDLH
ncbi:TetR/AcrR family transcriptional regulator [Rhodococcus koreensis]|uniref:TetR/AcrR family transcriptional regulator n=1 Tax=Rhodococcus koreensis TaxID=99653 RepID=UPI003671FD47